MLDKFHELSIVTLVFRGVFLPYKPYSDGHSKTKIQPSRVSVLQVAYRNPMKTYENLGFHPLLGGSFQLVVSSDRIPPFYKP